MPLFIHQENLSRHIDALRQQLRQAQELEEQLRKAQRQAPPEAWNTFAGMIRTMECVERGISDSAEVLENFLSEFQAYANQTRAKMEDLVWDATHLFQ